MSRNILCLDVGEARIGVAIGDLEMKIPLPYGAVLVDGSEMKEIALLVAENDVDTIVVGYPRNQSGEATKQTAFVENFSESIKEFATVVFQDESLTSVAAEQRLKASKKAYTKEDIDAEAAAIILADYFEEN